MSQPVTPASRLVESTTPKPPMAPPRMTSSVPLVKPLKVTKVTLAPPSLSRNPLDSLKEFTTSMSESIRPPPVAQTPPPTPPKPTAKKTPPTPIKTAKRVSNPLAALNDLALSISENIRPPPIAKQTPLSPSIPLLPRKPAVDLAKQQAAAKVAAEKRKKAQIDATAAQKAVSDRKKREAAEERKAAIAANKAAVEQRKQDAEARKAEGTARVEVERKKREAAIAASKFAAEQRKQEAEARNEQAELEAKKRAEQSRRDSFAKAKLAEIEARNVSRATPPAPPKSPTVPIISPDAINGLTRAISSATIGLLGLGKQELEELPEPSSAPAKKAPSGVPTLKRWRQNSDKSITGLVSGSRGFDDGDRVTTSPIASGTVAPGQVVRTGSGSRYFLS